MDHTPITREEAARELLFRESATDKVVDFARYTQATYEADPFHHLLGEYLEKVERGEIDRLMINTPPRHGKSELASIKFPAWFMARNPHNNVIQASYNLEQATRSSRKTRDIIEGEEFSRVFPQVKMSGHSRAADRWMLENGQEYFGVGVGTGATGKGGHLIIIDDPYKDSEECDSPTIREKVWDWYNSVILTRLERGGRLIIIQTRWHYDDLSGRLLEAEKKGGDKWTVLKLPAICTDPENDPMGRSMGEALSPGRRNVDELLRIKRGITQRFWSAMFQQEPISEEGAMFQARWFDEATRIPVKMKRVRAWDFGSTTNGDYTAGVLMARDFQTGEFYIEDVIRDRVSPMKVEQLVMETAIKDRQKYGHVQILIPQDPGQAGVSQSTAYIRRMAGFPIKAVRPSGPKETRAAGLAAQAEAKMVKIKPASWNKEFLEELSLFPLGSHDDQVDAAADAFNGLLGPGQAKILDW
jgi:predicted phage terminase large subunit-like protein